MEQLLFLLALLCAGHAEIQDLQAKVFTIPAFSATSAVKLNTDSEKPLTALTLCMRFHSTQSRSQSLFSLAIPTQSNAFLLYKPSVGVYRVHVNGLALDINGLPDDTNEWNSVCWTWGSASGLTTLWVNGNRSARTILAPGATLTGAPSIILGQDQDSYGGGFDQAQSFMGDMTDVHLWDNIISPCEIRFYMEGYAFTHGNLLNWKNLQFSFTGNVHVLESDFDKLACY